MGGGRTGAITPRTTWFEVEEAGSGVDQQEESRRLLLEKVQTLENEMTWLRARVERLEKEDEEERRRRVNPRHLVFEIGSVPPFAQPETPLPESFIVASTC